MTEIQVQRTINISTVPVEKARDYTRKKFREHGEDINIVLPNFTQNYLLIQQYCRNYTRDIPRYQMPVIEPRDMDEFERKLESGYIDIFAPHVKRKLFPDSFKSQTERDEWVTRGLHDGEIKDDKIPVDIQHISAGELKPVQSQIWLNLLVKYIIQYGLPAPGSQVTNTTIIISQEGYILDGHHRWGEVMLVNPSIRMKCLRVPFSLNKLLDLGRSYGSAIGNKPNY